MNYKNIIRSKKKINIELISNRKLEKLFHNASHQGIAAMIEPYKIFNINEFVAHNSTKGKIFLLC